MATNRRNQTQEQSSDLQTLSIQEFMDRYDMVQVNHSVSINVNGYPFVTFINADNKAMNIYFAVKDAGNYIGVSSDGEEVGVPIIKGFFDDLKIFDNGDTSGDKPRYKLGTGGASKRVNLADLLG